MLELMIPNEQLGVLMFINLTSVWTMDLSNYKVTLEIIQLMI